MTPRTGKLAACAVAACGGIAMVVLGIVHGDAGAPIGLFGLVTIYGAA
jgi:hypothetical protein